MKVIDKTISSSETSVEIDLFEGKKLSKRAVSRIQAEVGSYLIGETLSYMDAKSSPVQGGEYKKSLSPEYKKLKLKLVGNSEANLELSGALKSELDFKPTDVGIKMGVFGSSAGAADGHNNLSGQSTLPTRQFLPDVDQQYKRPIKSEIEKIVAEIIEEEAVFSKKDFSGIKTKQELYSKLSDIFGERTRAELLNIVINNEKLTGMLGDFNLLELL